MPNKRFSDILTAGVPATSDKVLGLLSGLTDALIPISSLASVFGGIRQKSIADVTLYVRSGGNDSNDGRSAGTAFATIPRAQTELANNIDMGNSNLIIDIGPGNWSGGPFVISPGAVGGNYSDVIVQGAGSANTRTSLWSGSSAGFELKKITIDAAMGDNFAGLYVGEHSEVVINDTDVVFATNLGGVSVDVYAYDFGALSYNTDYTVTGTKGAHFTGDFYGRYHNLGSHVIHCTGTTSFLNGFLLLKAKMHADMGSAAAFTGAATGAKFSITGPQASIGGPLGNIPGSGGSWVLDNNSLMALGALSKAGAPAAADLLTGSFTIIDDTTNNQTWLVYNKGGTIRKVQLT
jgi:hypothetical protein